MCLTNNLASGNILVYVNKLDNDINSIIHNNAKPSNKFGLYLT